MHSYMQPGEKTGAIVSRRHACAIFSTRISILFCDVQIKSCVSHRRLFPSLSLFSLSSFSYFLSLPTCLCAKSRFAKLEVADSANKCSPRRSIGGRKVPIMFPSRRWFYSLIFRSHFYLLEFAAN